MPLITYEDKLFADWKLRLIYQALDIVRANKKLGYDLTLRQVYYQFVAKDWLPERWADPKTGSTNNVRAYQNLGNLLADARMAGIMDWKDMVDRTREMDGNQHWGNPSDAISSMQHWYMIDKWQGQRFRPEVWVEKDALEGIVGRVARRLDVPFFSCRGYTSLTSIWENAQRMKDAFYDENSIPVILHLGDHDPSGIDMSRDIEERVRLFMDGAGEELVFKRIALNSDQIKRFKPPENPAKSTDSRYKGYKEIHGDHSWELDALDPTVIDKLIESEVLTLRDDDVYAEYAQLEAEQKALLTKASKNWDDIVKFLSKKK